MNYTAYRLTQYFGVCVCVCACACAQSVCCNHSVALHESSSSSSSVEVVDVTVGKTRKILKFVTGKRRYILGCQALSLCRMLLVPENK